MKLEDDNVKEKKSRKVLKIFLIVVLIIVILLAGLLIGASIFVKDKLNKIEYDNTLTADDIQVDVEVKQNLNKYRNIALFGLDARTDTFSGSRSDCIMIISINEETKEIRLLSVYRDTYLELTGRSLDKITHAYIYGGAELALNSLNNNMDLNITEYVTVNFDTVKTVVDAIGGVEIPITSAEAPSIPGIDSEGTYNLTGEQALAYSRIRKIDSDYKRTERMRDVLTAIFNKAKKFSLVEQNNLIDMILPHVRTNISSTEILELLPQIPSYKIGESIGWPYTVRAYTTPTWYGAPVTLESNVIQLHQELFNEPDYEPSETVQEISNKIIRKTGYR